MRLLPLLLTVVAGMGSLPMAFCASAGQDASTPVQTPPSPSKPPLAFQVKANLVLVDVVLSDKGAAVQGLHQDKFRIYENGALQTMTVFEEHKSEDAVPAAAHPKFGPGVYSDFPQFAATGALNVLLLDGLNTPLSNQVYVRDQMLEYLKSIPAGTRLAVFTLASRLRMVEGFTTDPNVIAKAISAKGSGQQSVILDPSGDQQQSDTMNDLSDLGASQSALSSVQQFQADLTSFQTDIRVQMTLDAMKALARYLSVLPGRKNLIWFSGSFPLAIDPDATLASPFQAMRTYSQDLQQTDNMLAAARVSVYPIDARGLMTLPSANAANKYASGGMPRGGGRSNGGRKGGAGQGSGPGSGGGLAGSGAAANQSAVAAADQKFLTQTAEEHASMLQIAEDTGGEAFVNTSGLKGAVAQAIHDGSHYYTVGYVPALKTYDGGYRHIRVEVEGGYQAAYRRGYYADDPAKSGVNPQASLNAMNAAGAYGAPPLSEILFKVKILSANDPGAKGLKLNAGAAGETAKDIKGPVTRYLLDFAVDPFALGFSTTPDGVRHAREEFAVIAYDGDGKRLNYVDRGVALNLTGPVYAQVMHGGIPLHEEIDLPAGLVHLRLVVHDLDNSKVGSTEVPVLVAKK